MHLPIATEEYERRSCQSLKSDAVARILTSLSHRKTTSSMMMATLQPISRSGLGLKVYDSHMLSVARGQRGPLTLQTTTADPRQCTILLVGQETGSINPFTQFMSPIKKRFCDGFECCIVLHDSHRYCPLLRKNLF